MTHAIYTFVVGTSNLKLQSSSFGNKHRKAFLSHLCSISLRSFLTLFDANPLPQRATTASIVYTSFGTHSPKNSNMPSEPPGPPTPHYNILRLPTTSPNLTTLVTKYRSTKLTALRTNPKEWVQQYDIENSLPLSVWHTRLLDLNIITLICVATDDPDLSNEEALLTGDWVGMEAALGPIAFDEYHAAFASATPPARPSPDKESRWHIRDLYVSPAHRGRGIAMKLREALFNVVSREARAAGALTARMRIIVNPKNTWLVEWDRRCGFGDYVMVTLREGLVANGMGESVPQDTGSSGELRAVWETRYGMCMERAVGV